MPSAGPTISSAVRTSDSTAEVTWTPLSLAVARGQVTSYSVKYQSMTSQSEDCSASDASTWTAMPRTTSTTSLVIVGLNPSLGYCVAVAATTSAGTGPYGTPGTIPRKLSTVFVGLVLLSHPLHPAIHRGDNICVCNTNWILVLLLPRATSPGA